MDVTSFVGSHVDHYATSLGISNGQPVAVGGVSKETEMFSNGTWVRMTSIPVTSQSYYQLYSTVTLDDVMYTFGGKGTQNDAFMFFGKTWPGEWRATSPMLSGRSGHRSVIQGNRIVHVGGYPIETVIPLKE